MSTRILTAALLSLALACAVRAEAPVVPWNPIYNSGSSTETNTLSKLNTFVIPSVQWTGVEVHAALQDMETKSKAADPNHVGLKFILMTAGQTMASNGYPLHFKVSVVLDNVPLKDLLLYITQQTNLQCKIAQEAGTVYLTP